MEDTLQRHQGHRSSVLTKYAAPYKLKTLAVNQLHNCYVLHEHCYILSNISQ